MACSNEWMTPILVSGIKLWIFEWEQGAQHQAWRRWQRVHRHKHNLWYDYVRCRSQHCSRGVHSFCWSKWFFLGRDGWCQSKHMFWNPRDTFRVRLTTPAPRLTQSCYWCLWKLFMTMKARTFHFLSKRRIYRICFRERTKNGAINTLLKKSVTDGQELT